MKAHLEFDAVFAANDDMILGAFQAMSDAGIDPSNKVTIGWDASSAGLASIKQGKLGAIWRRSQTSRRAKPLPSSWTTSRTR